MSFHRHVEETSKVLSVLGVEHEKTGEGIILRTKKITCITVPVERLRLLPLDFLLYFRQLIYIDVKYDPRTRKPLYSSICFMIPSEEETVLPVYPYRSRTVSVVLLGAPIYRTLGDRDLYFYLKKTLGD